jgi:hypothetical protein
MELVQQEQLILEAVVVEVIKVLVIHWWCWRFRSSYFKYA